MALLGGAAQRRPGPDPRPPHVRGERVGRHVLGVVEGPDDDRLVGVAVLEGDEDLLPDPREGVGSPRVPGQRRRDAQPGAAVRVLLPLAVPVELHLDPPVLVDVDVLSRRPDDDGRLGSLRHRAPRTAGRPVHRVARETGERVLVLRTDVVGPEDAVLPVVLHAGQDVRTVPVVVPAEVEPETRDHVPDVPAPHDLDGPRLLPLHDDPRPDVAVQEDLLDLLRPVAPSRLDSVEGFGVAARKPVELPLVGVGEPQLVRNGSDLERVLEKDDLLEVVRRHLEAPVAKSHLAARQGLPLLPDPDPVLVPSSAHEGVVVQGAGAGKVGVHTAVGDDERVIAVFVPEVPANPLLLHQTAGEGEVVLAVLEAHLPRLVRPAELNVGREAFEDLLEDVRNVDLLEHPAAVREAEHPDLRSDPEPPGREGLVLRLERLPWPLLQLDAEPVEPPHGIALGGVDRHGHALPEEGVEGDVRIVGGKGLQLEIEELRDPLGSLDPPKKEDVLAEGRLEPESAVVLAVVRHRRDPFLTLVFPELGAGRGA